MTKAWGYRCEQKACQSDGFDSLRDAWRRADATARDQFLNWVLCDVPSKPEDNG
jgi:hypothetical protein